MMVHGVNQPSDRQLYSRLDPGELASWADDHLPEPHRIFWDDSRKWFYESSQPEDDKKKHPWLYRVLALEILHRVFVGA